MIHLVPIDILMRYESRRGVGGSRGRFGVLKITQRFLEL